jgi:hypothetical protein
MKQHPDSTSIALDDLRTIPEMVEMYPSRLSLNALRWYLRDRDRNGLALAVVPVGKKLLISQARFEQWLGSRAGTIPSHRSPSAALQRAA